jgi:RNA polymerase sigma factor (sigma-70 family)
MNPEEQIAEHLTSGKIREAFDLMVDTFSRPLYHHIRGMVHAHEDTDDILQEVYIKIWRGLPAFRSDSKAYTWAYRIATNETLSWIKRNKKHRHQDLDSNWNLLEGSTLPSPIKIQQIFEMGLQQLPPKQALVFKLRYFDEMPFQEMSELLKTSTGALKASYHHAFKKLEAWIKLNHEA